MRHVFVDANVFAYAFGEESAYRGPCLALVEHASAGVLRFHASVEAVQEVLHHRMRRTTREAALRETAAMTATCVLHDFDRAVLDKGIELVSTAPIRGRDAVHAATALLAGFDEIVTTDATFANVPGLRRVDPADLSPL